MKTRSEFGICAGRGLNFGFITGAFRNRGGLWFAPRWWLKPWQPKDLVVSGDPDGAKRVWLDLLTLGTGGLRRAQLQPGPSH